MGKSTLNKILVILIIIIAAILVYKAVSSVELPKIGVISAQEGLGSSYGLLVSNTVLLALEEIGADPDNVVIVDGKCDKETARQAADTLIAQGIKYIIAGACSGETLGISEHPEVVAGNVVAITSMASSTEISKVPQILRTIPSDLENVKALVSAIRSRSDNKLVVIGDEGQYARTYSSAFRSELPDSISITDEFVYERDPNTLQEMTLAAVVAASHADAIVLIPQSAEDAKVVIELLRTKSDIQIYEPTTLSGETLRVVLGDDIEGAIFIGSKDISKEDDRFTSLKSKYEAQFGTLEYNPHLLSTYDAVLLLKDAIGNVGDEPSEVLAYLRGNKHKDDSGVGIDRYTFVRGGDSINDTFIPVAMVIRNGKPEVL